MSSNRVALRRRARLISTLGWRDRLRSSRETGIASPVVTVLHARPVAAHQPEPLCRGAFVWLQTRKVIARFHTGAGAFGLGALRLNDENAAGEGQLHRREAYATLLEPTVSTVGLGKRGELTAPAASACLSSAG